MRQRSAPLVQVRSDGDLGVSDRSVLGSLVVKLARLTALKDAVDPDNVFHLSQNIRPTDRAVGSR